MVYLPNQDAKIAITKESSQILPVSGVPIHTFKNSRANKVVLDMLGREKVSEVYGQLKEVLGVEAATRFLLVIATESGGNYRDVNKNRNGTYDCGLLQINQKGSCTEKSFSTDWQVSQTIAKYRYNKFKPWYGAWYWGNLKRLVGVRAIWNVV